MGEPRQRKASLIALRRSVTWLRGEVGRRLRMRHAPEIRFFEDTSVDDAFRLEEILKEIHAEEEDDRNAGD
ncbi:MAG TPA: ribosome-binding factor A [Candidatus Hydrogenedentes bacterium]|nr:ribosome-binding factor A [Candidatus Hydrogenedentota bacterium]